MGRPAMGRSTLQLSRVEPSRAGITAAMRNVLMQASLHERWGRAHIRHYSARKTIRAGLTSNPADRIIMTGTCAQILDPPIPAWLCGPRIQAAPTGGVAQMVRATDS